MKRLAEIIGGFVFLATWLAGIAIASGFWATTLAVFFPPWAWYLLVEKAIMVAGWVGA